MTSSFKLVLQDCLKIAKADETIKKLLNSIEAEKFGMNIGYSMGGPTSFVYFILLF